MQAILEWQTPSHGPPELLKVVANSFPWRRCRGSTEWAAASETVAGAGALSGGLPPWPACSCWKAFSICCPLASLLVYSATKFHKRSRQLAMLRPEDLPCLRDTSSTWSPTCMRSSPMSSYMPITFDLWTPWSCLHQIQWHLSAGSLDMGCQAGNAGPCLVWLRQHAVLAQHHPAAAAAAEQVY